ncbi:glycosyltransferase family 9 protein [Desulfogranum mediterraneum]|uniref:glycosyltransferase family 9 protein n=1 Tax=Desulfogranum mediterraneum TaxID=160661 RepID=UPI00048AA6FD|nr:glycosyltransferase family 9 protein [Desulfogranum mediterraneum]
MASQPVALVGGYGLGDNLIEMVLLENARLLGYETTVYSNVICQLREWFPGHRVQPSLAVDDFASVLPPFELFFWSGSLPEPLAALLAAKTVDYMARHQEELTQVENMSVVCGHCFPGHQPVLANGITPPGGLVGGKYPRRVCLHPTSAEESKNWLPRRFSRLARRLAAQGYEPVIVMSEQELCCWQPLFSTEFPLLGFASLTECAAYLYESGYFIGNDSGGGHLASCLGVPTLSIHGRKKKARVWQPGWGQVRVVTPVVNFIGSYLRQHYWKYLLSTGRVERAFHTLVQLG